MPSLAAPPPSVNVDPFVQAYEAARARNGRAFVGDHLPPGTHPDYVLILAELVRVDLEYGWADGHPRFLDKYLAEFPDLRHDSHLLTDVAFEEFRQRLEHDEQPTPQEYRRKYGIDTDAWAAEGDEVSEPAAGRVEIDIAATQVVEHTPPPMESLLAPQHTPPPRANLDASSVKSLNDAADAAKIYRQFHEAGGSLASFNMPLGPANLLAEAARVYADLQASNPTAAARYASAISAFPEVGTVFAGFHLIEVLGKGTFGCVYLARQGELADRMVALKVAPDLTGEPQTLARLQHTNIVPVYSVHKVGTLQVVCMPYFGSVTLADVIGDLGRQKTIPGTGQHFVSTLNHHANKHSARSVSRTGPFHSVEAGVEVGPASDSIKQSVSHEFLTKLTHYSYVEAVLWLGARLADGLGHAHDRGIVHRDLKPANILLTDEGQPMLLDFNLASNDHAKSPGAAARIGGTLPYMAPEHIAAFRGEKQEVDARSDVYSLGLLLFELLAGRHPFPTRTGALSTILPLMVDERRKGPPRLREYNPAVSPATEAIVLKCLDPDPNRRYPTARALQEDLDRQLADQPLLHTPEPSRKERLRKFARRNPRLTSTGSIVAVSFVSVCALLGMIQWLVPTVQQRHASVQWAGENDRGGVRKAVRQLQGALGIGFNFPDTLRSTIQESRDTLEQYHILSNPQWNQEPAFTRLPELQQQAFRREMADLLYLTAQASALEARRAREVDQAEIAEAVRLTEIAVACVLPEERPASYENFRARLLGKDSPSHSSPRTPREMYLMAADLLAQKRREDALVYAKKATADQPDLLAAQFTLGHCYFGLGNYTKAEAAYDTCTALAKDFHWAYYTRGLAKSRHKNPDYDYLGAKEDFSKAIEKRNTIPVFYVDRSVIAEKLKDYKAAIDDLTKALELGAQQSRIYHRRAWDYVQFGNMKAAAVDHRIALLLPPVDAEDWVERGREKSNSDPQGALADFDRALELNSSCTSALFAKALVLSKKLWRTDEAIRVLQSAAELRPNVLYFHAGLGLMYARNGDREKALAELQLCHLGAENADSRALYLAAGAHAWLSEENSQDTEIALNYLARALNKGYGANWVESDRDLEPIRDNPKFVAALQSARKKPTNEIAGDEK